MEASKLLIKFSQKLWTDAEQQQQFIHALTQPRSFSPCILWTKPRPEPFPFAVEPALLWQAAFVDRLTLGERPGQHSLHKAGYFYCLDFSSVFAATPLLAIRSSSQGGVINAPVRLVVDMCASPGGKSIFAWAALQPDYLLSNEVIGKRIGALLSNLKRCQIEPAVVSNLDPEVLAEAIPQTAEVVLVDAPCTGQSLLAKGGKAPGCFHPVSINKNANRQKRIIANSARVVAPGGYLLYMTCAYSPEENEQVCEWFLEKFSQFQPIAVDALSAYRSHLAQFPCYRMFPQLGLGAGAFSALFQNTAGFTINGEAIDRESADNNAIEEAAAQRLKEFLQRPRLISTSRS
ncbi:RsmB/NOP family class I SAM-dependent RNA methyltransferase [Leptolyngbya sp. FACHB-711]|uniref:RsmB/NOP family class I SAM-dependent RNA methyltransferase n=1 Tax=unclassified Leptolyngbya TaxID=2650499 RepID=UPI0016893077|nr:RsmB/NOP family class I SAM-dependent RNA methyltransferase [Leptolyngbya sp. FACHB-711]MBD1852523.1 RsmB/NOP family class I SAM-dependent RNA methyltransferase [Cyanobacteria bacterium FACHB-502]MBD2023165.1 RsmB/NOP family class I SAM-dependent RNA methyltransferase [Leptolyngbya sp. FACHB-711]